MRFDGAVVLVTGGGQGIGRETCLGFARHGARVACLDFRREAAEQVAREIGEAGGDGLAVTADVTNAAAVTSAVAQVEVVFDRIDILVNNAGGSARAAMSDFAVSSPATWSDVLGRNLIGTLTVTRAVLPLMLKQGGGKIVNIGSGTGVSGSPRQADYSAAKAGVIGFTKALAKEVGISGVNVNTVSPGVVRTEGLADVPPATVQANLDRQAIKRLGEPDDIANAVMFLASDMASFITGQNLVVCGGGRIS